MSVLAAQAKPAAIPSPSVTTKGTGLLQRKCACGGVAGVTGECEACRKKRLRLQTKLAVNGPGDIYEREADRVAGEVLAKPGHAVVSSAPPRIQRVSGHASGSVDAAPASVDQALAGAGSALEPALRQDMEQRFGHDFSRVRVHTGARAERSARDVNAHAYTVGQSIVFGIGKFAPETHEGRRLIAHELTHVVQQSVDGNRPGETNGQVVQRKPDENALAKAADPIDEDKFPDYAWHRVMQTSTHGSPEGDVIRAILEENTAIGRELLAETTRKSTYRNYLRGGTKRPSYFSFVHPTRGVVARAFAALAGFHPEKKPAAKVLLEEAHAYEIYVFSPHSVNDPPHYAYPVPLSSAPPLPDAGEQTVKAVEPAVPVKSPPLPDYMTCTRPADCVIAQLKLAPNIKQFTMPNRLIDTRTMALTNTLAPLAMGELLTTLEEVRSRGWLFHLATLASLYPEDLRDRERAAIFTVQWNTPSKGVSVETALALAAKIPQDEQRILLDYDYTKATEKQIAPLLAPLDINRPKSQAELNREAVTLAEKQWRRRKFWNSLNLPDDLTAKLATTEGKFRDKLEELDIYWDSAEKSLKRKPFVDALERQVVYNAEANGIYNKTYADLEYNEPVEKSTFKKVMDVICEHTSPCKENIEQLRADKASGMSDADAEARGLFRIFTAFIPSKGPRGPIVRTPGGPPAGTGFTLPEFKLPTLEPALSTPKLRTAVPEPSPTMKPIPIPEPTPTAKPTVKPTAKLTPDPAVTPTVQPIPTPTPTPKQTPRVTPGDTPDVLPVTPTRIEPDTQQRQRRRCPYPTGLTPSDAIPIRWLKPRDDYFYPKTIELNGGDLDRDDPDTSLPDGVRIGVQERFWPRLGKVMRLVSSVRSGAEADFAATLVLWGYQRADTLQIDHVQDLQWCGADETFGGNFWPLESSTNMSAGGTQNNLQRVTFCPSADSIPAVNWTLAQLKQAGYYGRYFTIQEVTFVLPSGALGLTVRPYPPDTSVTCDE
jgi:hypothetical protein